MIGHPEVIVASGAPSYHRRLAWVCGYALRTSSMCELGDGVCRSGWLHGQEWLCYWGGAAICEIAAGSCGGGWLHSQEWLCYWGELRFARLRLGVVGVGGCTAKSGCATKSRRRIDFVEDSGAAGPGPVLGMSGQSCHDGIVLDVGADGVELFGRADPMVEGLVLPEMFLLQGED